MDRKIKLATASSLAVLPAFLTGPGCMAQPNIVFFLVDDMGWGDLGYLGNEMVETPNIDAFAAAETAFSCAYAAPESSPTRASLLTGKNPARLHLTTWISQPGGKKADTFKGYRMPNEVTGIPLSEYFISEALRDNGYDTWHIGKWHIGEEELGPTKQGFDCDIAYWPWSYPKSYFSPYGLPTITDGPKGEYIADRLTDEAVKLIQNHGSKPFFLNLWHYSVHQPLKGKPELVKYYSDKGAPAEGKDNATYTAMKHSVDDSFGRILKAIDDAGIADNTIVVFFTDNGGVVQHADNGPLRMGKKYLYEGGIRVPLIIRAPQFEKGTTVEIPVSSIDFYPTMLDWAGIDPAKVPQKLDGQSMMKSVKKKDYDRSLFWHEMGAFGSGPVTAMRRGDYKLLYYYARPEADRFELYNVKTDISETDNIARKNPKIVDSMYREMQKWLKDNRAQLPVRIAN